MTSYTAHFEIDISPTEKRVTGLMDDLQQWSPAVGRSEHNRMEATVTFEAASIWKAMTFAREAFDGIIADPIRFEVLPTAVFDQRSQESEGSGLVSVTEASTQLGVSRQRVLQMIDEGKLQAERVGRSWNISATSLAWHLQAHKNFGARVALGGSGDGTTGGAA